jgi:hypothetical protein
MVDVVVRVERGRKEDRLGDICDGKKTPHLSVCKVLSHPES